MINISNIEIEYEVKRLASLIVTDYGDSDFTALILMNGAMFFGADLLRYIGRKGLYPEITSLRSSYYTDLDKTRKAVIIHNIPVINTKKILIIDDVFDTGETLHKIYEIFCETHDIEFCCLLKKDKKRDVKIIPKYVGFSIKDTFIYGYGLDYKNRYRNVYRIVDDLTNLKGETND